MVGWARGKVGEPGATVRPGQAAAPCWDRQQAGYPSPECLIQPQPWGCFLARGIPPCSELPRQLGSAAPGALQTWVALGNAAGPGSGRKSPWGWAGGGAEPGATRPRSPGCPIPGWAPGIPAVQDWLTTAFPASHLCQVKAEVFGAACGTWSTPETGTVGHRGF